MENWTLHKIIVEKALVLVYVNDTNTIARVHPFYGRSYKVISDVNALDLAKAMLLGCLTHYYSPIIASMEDTVSIDLEHVA